MENKFNLTIRVSWLMQLIQILFAILCTAGSIVLFMALVRGAGNSLFGFILLGALAYMGWANAFSTIQISEKSVTVNVFYGRFRISWDEVDHIVLNSPFIALMGNGKRVVLSLAFAGKNATKMLEFFQQQIEQRNIMFEKDAAPFPVTHLNARVWWKAPFEN